ncbi:TATA-box-Hypothetical protein protein [Nesidiocoris tenuis]|uniref:Queuine tRNA-ribosyltransferase catalytic subunit 1 n=1 Tax=Nesidiocoris tenuis TaxID=355587 RepID=A0ABN7BDF3_9HEMI|nr:TATA-box-Hypothetical protein protein [Nesidiocoris tenuis]
MSWKSSPLSFKILKECDVSKARTSLLALPHHTVETPVFMPVGTKGSLKGLLPDQLEAMDCQIMLGNTYHLGTNPGPELLEKAGGLHKFIGWERALLTDSGGFQMVSLLKFAEIVEEGVTFESPYDSSKKITLTPEESIRIQNAIGADIAMQLDDVVPVLTTGPRVEEAMNRTVRWLDRCLAAHKRPDDQNIFPIVQGGLNEDLRTQCVEHLTKREVNGFAVGGLSGGEAKDDFWRVVNHCSDRLPTDKPRYCMGVGFAADLVVCVALGIDMFDCVYPTRTARFGCGLVDTGQINLKHKKYAFDFTPIQDDCGCSTCKRYTKAYLHTIVTQETVACHLITVHNIFYQLRLMRNMREAIKEQRFPEFVKDFMAKMFASSEVPKWIRDALRAVNIPLEDTQSPE